MTLTEYLSQNPVREMILRSHMVRMRDISMEHLSVHPRDIDDYIEASSLLADTLETIEANLAECNGLLDKEACVIRKGIKYTIPVEVKKEVEQKLFQMRKAHFILTWNKESVLEFIDNTSLSRKFFNKEQKKRDLEQNKPLRTL